MNLKKISAVYLAVISVIILFFLLYFLISSESVIKKEEKIVTKIIDGDTIIVEGGETVRLLGIDCDERGKKCYGKSKNYLEENLLGKIAFLEADTENKDIYGRSLRYIFLNGENINKELVKRGYCIARFADNEKYKKEIQDAEQFAINNKIGCKWQE